MPRQGNRQALAWLLSLAIALTALAGVAIALFMLDGENDSPEEPMLIDPMPLADLPPRAHLLPLTASARCLRHAGTNRSLVGWDEMSAQAGRNRAALLCNLWGFYKTLTCPTVQTCQVSACSAKPLPPPPALPAGSWLLVVEEPGDPLEAFLRARERLDPADVWHSALLLANPVEAMPWSKVRFKAEEGSPTPPQSFRYRVFADEASCRRALKELPPTGDGAESDRSWLDGAVREQQRRVQSLCSPEAPTLQCKRNRRLLDLLQERRKAPTRPLAAPLCRPARLGTE